MSAYEPEPVPVKMLVPFPSFAKTFALLKVTTAEPSLIGTKSSFFPVRELTRCIGVAVSFGESFLKSENIWRD